MWFRLKSSISYIFNCVIIELISGQINEVILQTSGLNLTSNQLLTKSGNTSLLLDMLDQNDQNQISLETIANYSVNICDDIDCSHNKEICEQNRCSPKKRIKRTHYIVTCAIVLVMIGLMLTTIYFCHKESNRLNRWHNSCNTFDDNMIAIRFVNSLRYNRRYPHISPIHEMLPLSIPSESPPPYDLSQYTPPPDYHEVVRSSHGLEKINT